MSKMRRHPLNYLEEAAYRWWLTKRPVGWTEEDHHQNPDINCMSDAESNLAIQTSNMAASQR